MLELLLTQTSKRKAALFFGLSILLTAICSLGLQHYLILPVKIIDPNSTRFWMLLAHFFLSGRFIISLVIFLGVYYLFYNILPMIIEAHTKKRAQKYFNAIGKALVGNDLEEKLKKKVIQLPTHLWTLKLLVDNNIIKLIKREEGPSYYKLVATKNYLRFKGRVGKSMRRKQEQGLGQEYYPIPIGLMTLIIFDFMACSEVHIPIWFWLIVNLLGIAYLNTQITLISFLRLVHSKLDFLIRDPTMLDEILEKRVRKVLKNKEVKNADGT